jgi:hypothetical protein
MMLSVVPEHWTKHVQYGSDSIAHHARCCNLYLVDPRKSVRARWTHVEKQYRLPEFERVFD